ncbi:MAG: ROK family protein [Firmicutes bacterium]|nr:ROK family protein [Bacillota bacterium]
MDNKKYTLGIDIGGTSIKFGIVDCSGHMVCQDAMDTKSDILTPTQILDNMCEMIHSICKNVSIETTQLDGIGVGCPGLIDANGVVLYNNNMHWENVPIKQHLESKIGTTVCVANDADAAALGEQVFGSGKDYSDIVFLTVGTGIGGGVVKDGKLWAGAELGHHILIQGGQLCTCGLNGCFESYCSAIVFINWVSEKLGKKVTLMHIWQNYSDPQIKPLVDEYVSIFATATINLINIFNPQVVVVGGGISHTGNLFLDLLQQRVQGKYYGANYKKPVEFKYASLQNGAGIYGAVALTRQ